MSLIQFMCFRAVRARETLLTAFVLFASFLFAGAAQGQTDLQVSALQITEPAGSIFNGAPVTFIVNVENNGTASISDAVLQVQVSSNMLVLPADVPAGCSVSGASSPQTLTCALPTLVRDPSNPDFTLTYIATAQASGAQTTQATISSPTITDPNSTNDSLSITPTVQSGADLSVTASSNVPSVPAGGQYTQTYTVSNGGPDSVNAAQLTISLPPASDFDLVSATGSSWSCAPSGGASQSAVCDYSGPSVPPNSAFPPIDIVGEALVVSGTLTSQADVQATGIGIGDPDAANDVSDPLVVSITPGADLEAGIEILPSFISNETGVLTLMITNNGPLAVPAGSTITHTLDSALALNGPLPPGCSGNPTIVCTADALANAAAASFVIPIVAMTDTGGNRTLSATVNIPAGIDDPNAGNDTATDQFQINDPAADFQLRSKSKTPSVVSAGATMTSTIRIRNLGPSAADWSPSNPIIITDDLQTEETFDSLVTNGWSCSTGPSPVSGFATRVTCQTTDSGTLSVNQNKNLVITTIAGAGADTTLTNSATVDTSQLALSDPNPSNNTRTDSSRATTEAANLSLQSRVGLSQTGPFGASTTLPAAAKSHFIELVVTNDAGGDLARTVNINNNLSGWVDNTINFNGGSVTHNTTVSLVSTSDPGDSCSRLATTNNQIRCQVRNLPAGSSRTLVLQVDRAILEGTRTQNFTISSPNTIDTDPNDNADSVEVTIEPNADLIVNDKRINPDPIRSGGVGTYVVDILNIGPDAGDAVASNDSIDPSLFEVVDVTTTAPGGTCDYGVTTADTATCDLGSVLSGEAFQMNIQVRPRFPFSTALTPADFPINHINTASVSTSTFELSTANNPGSLTHSVSAPSLDLSVTNNEPAGFSDPSVFGRTLLYQIRSQNFGATLGTSVVTTVTPNPPAGLLMEFNPAESTIPADVSCAQSTSADPVICNLPNLANSDLSVMIIGFDVVDNGAGIPSASQTFGTTAVISSAQQAFDTPTANNEAVQTTSVLPSTDLEAVSKVRVSPSPPATINVNQPVVYDIVFRNNGPSPTTQVRVTDDLPAGFELTSTPVTVIASGGVSIASAPACTGTTSVTCVVDGLFPGNGDTFTLRLEARPVFPFTGSLTAPVQNNASIDVGLDASGLAISGDEVPGNNSVVLNDSIAQASSIAGRVFNDQDRSGNFSSGEGINGVTLTLRGTDLFNNTISATVTTATDGSYIFDGLPPANASGYTIEETQPAEHFDSVEIAGSAGGVVDNTDFDDSVQHNQITAIVLGEDVDATGYDFAELREAEVSGFIYSDQNNNGERDVSESGISSGFAATPHLRLSGQDYSGDVIVITASVNGSGRYTFSAVPPSDATGYTIQQLQEPSGFVDGLEENGSGVVVANSVDSTETISIGVLDPGASLSERNFGHLETISLSGVIFLDENMDGARQAGEGARVSGAIVTLTGTNDLGQSVSCTFTTGADGTYAFPVAACPGLRPGTYQLELSTTGGGVGTGSSVGSEGGTSSSNTIVASISLEPGDAGVDYDFGVEGQSLSGLVYIDSNADGSVSATEQGIPGVSFTLSGSTSGGQDVCTLINCNAVSGADGSFAFSNVPASDATGYMITQQSQSSAPLSAYIDGIDTRGTIDGTPTGVVGADSISGIVIGAGEAGSDYLFGEGGASLSGLVFLDVNNDGSASGDAGIAGVEITLSGTTSFGQDVCTYLAALSPSGSCTTTTISDGTFAFADLPAGTYALSEAQPAAFADGQDTVGTAGGTVGADSVTGITLGAGATGENYSFGEQDAVINGTVFLDLGARDGTQAGSGEPGLGGITLTLRDSGGAIVGTTTTNADGSYSFTGLPAGNYTVEQTQTDDYSSSTPNSVALSVSPGATETVDFGETVSSLAGVVFLDNDNSGAFNAGDNGVDGVTITLSGTTDSGEDVCTLLASQFGGTPCVVTTASGGAYGFPALPHGSYQITESQPAGLQDGPDTVGSAGGVVASDVFSVTLNDPVVDATGYNFGEIGEGLGGVVYFDRNNNGVRDSGEPGIPGVQLNLSGTAFNGVDVCTLTNCVATTSADGGYMFTAVPGSNATGFTITQQSQATAPLSAYADGAETVGTVASAVTGSAGNDVISGIVYQGSTAGVGYNFGELGSSLSGSVFVDANADGALSAGETGLSGVQIALSGTTANGEDICVFLAALVPAGSCSITTLADGSYSFPDLPAGTYAISESQPTGFSSGVNTAGTASGTVSADQISSISLSAGEQAGGYLFAELGGAISGRVFDDINSNGVDDAEAGIAGVQIELLNSGGTVIATTTTNAAGEYSFDGLVFGDYTVRETQPSGFGSSTPNTVPVTLSSGTTSENVSFGETRSSLSGIVFIDADGDIAQDVGEDGIPSVIVTLTGTDDSGASVSLTGTTDSNGAFTFSGLLSGTYTLTQTQPSAYADGGEAAGDAGGTVGNDVISGIGLSTGTDATGYLFAEQAFAIGGQVFFDRNRNQARDGAQEIGQPGVTIELLDSSGAVVGTAITDANGNYSFPGLVAGDYTIRQVQPAGYGSSTPDSVAVTLAADTSIVVDFGDTLSTIGGAVFVDANDDGVLDPGEAGIAGVVVTLSGADASGAAVSRTVITAADGQYVFDDLLAGNYTITETQPTEYADGSEAAGPNGGVVGDDQISNISLPVGTDADGYVFGELADDLLGSVYVDLDGDGVRDENEPGIADVEIILLDAGGTEVARTTTGPDGSYTFENLSAGDYTIREVQPDGYADGEENSDNEAQITLTPNQSVPAIRFGERTGSLSGSIFNDVNGDGVQGSGEPPIAGVAVTLTGTDVQGNNVEITATTDEDGSYTFENLVGGTYEIVETQPANFDDAEDFAGTAGGTAGNDVIANVALPAAEDATGYIFTEFATNAAISGSIWRDLDHDRVNDDGVEPQVGAWIVRLYWEGDLVAETTTDVNGNYIFEGLVPRGGYEVQFINPANNVMFGGGRTNETGAEVEDGVQSSANPGAATIEIGSISNIEVGPAEEITEQSLPLDPMGVVYNSVTRELVAGATVSIDGPPGFDPSLHLVGGLPNASQVTGDDGLYQFLLLPGAPAGAYGLSILAPEGFSQTTPSELIPPCPGTFDAGPIPDPLLIQLNDGPPPESAPQSCSPGQVSTAYFLSFDLDPLTSADVLNNHIPVDPILNGALTITKSTPLLRVSRGDLVPYIITATNTETTPVRGAALTDRLPAGFRYIEGSATIDGLPVEPVVAGLNIAFPALDFEPGQSRELQLITVIGSGVREGRQTNNAFATNTLTGELASNIAEATVLVEPDPDFDCTDIIGKVFDDRNGNGYQDEGEPGLPGVRLVTVNGLLITTDNEGRYHITCAAVPNEDIGSNFVLKLDTRTLPTGYRLTTDNPNSIRLSRGKFAKLNFGASALNVVRVTLSDAAFEDGTPTNELRTALEDAVLRIERHSPVVRLTYIRGGTDGDRAETNLKAAQDLLSELWSELDSDDDTPNRARLILETEYLETSSVPSAAISPGELAKRDNVEDAAGSRRRLAIIDKEAVHSNVEQSGANSAGVSAAGFSITFDGGEPSEETGAAYADIQRRADLELERSDIQLKFDPLTATPFLNIAPRQGAAVREKYITFDAVSNYALFIERAELRIFAAGSSVLKEPLRIVPAEIGEPITWTPDDRVPDDVSYVLRVYDADGRFDETAPQNLTILSGPLADTFGGGDPIGDSRIAIQNIKLSGGSVTVHADALAEGQTFSIMGLPASVDTNGVGLAQQIVPLGETSVDVTIVDSDGTVSTVTRDIEIPKNDSFFVGQADITAGYRGLSDANRAFDGPETNRDEGFVQGRFAFFYKGRFADWLDVTASADTGEEEFGDLFSNFDERDPRSFLRRIDPRLNQPVFGDDSTTVEAAPTSGKFFLRLENGLNSLQWGNFQTRQTGTEFTNYSRSLYGLETHLETESTTAFGESRAYLNAFAADPGTRSEREEFRGTGGSVFFLRRQDISVGSERLFVEVRDRDSGIVISRRELIPGRDFEVNYIQGRITLREPLSTTSDGILFVRYDALAGNPQFLVANYEFSTSDLELDNFQTGGRASTWLNDFIQVGVSGFRQDDAGEDQSLYGGDITLRYKPGTFIRFEAAESRGTGSATFSSATGGFEFNELTAPDSGPATATRLEATVDLAEVTESLNGRVSTYWQDRGAGFSGPGQITFGEEVSQYGGQADVAVSDRSRVVLKGDVVNGERLSTAAIEGGVEHARTSGLFAAAGLRHDDRGGQQVSLSPLENERGSRTDLNVQAGYATRYREDAAERRDWSAYAFGQATLETTGSRQENDRIGVGGDVQINQRLKLDGEVSSGALGLGAKGGAEYQFGDQSSVYLGYSLLAENPDAFNTGQLGRLTSGVKTRFSDTVSVFAEGRLDHGQGPSGFTQNYGIDLTPGERWAYGFTFETGDLSDPDTGDISRDAVTGSVSYANDAITASALLEYRQDDSEQIGDRQIFGWRLNSTYQATPDWRAYAKVHGSIADSSVDSILDADFLEVIAAGAFRPVSNDRFNGLFKYTWLEDLPSAGQVTANGSAAEFAQRSHVASADGTYQLTPWLAVGAKAAYRVSELRLSRDASAPWFDSQALFLALRGDLRLVKEWDIAFDIRRLAIQEAEDSRLGGVLAVYRHLGDHVKAGIGYNFADFSDDLTDLDFNENGVFVNLLATF
ncbi:MAG: SdrD B-like domain-containing protein [Pseudomonadota bacterium]